MTGEAPSLEVLRAELRSLETRMMEIEARNKERFAEQALAVKTAMEASEKASTKVETAAAATKAEQNEWRGTVNDITTRLPTRVEIEAEVKAMAAAIADIKSRMDRNEGSQTGRAALLALALAAVTLYTFFTTQTESANPTAQEAKP
jgi:hypothetical protein